MTEARGKIRFSIELCASVLASVLASTLMSSEPVIAQEQPTPSGDESAAPERAESAVPDRNQPMPIDATNQLTAIPLTGAGSPQFVRMAPAGSKPSTEDYLPEVFKATKDRVFRFKTMPIPVFITPFQDAGFTDACIKGFEQWENRSNGLIRFVQVDNPGKARVQVVWKRLGVDPKDPDTALGAHTITKWKKNPATLATLPVGGIPVPLMIPNFGSKYSVPPQVIEVNLDLIYRRENDVRLLLLQNVVTHELGHALGILGHSPIKGDMMYKETDECSRLSQRDVNTLTRLYRMKADVPL